MASGGSSVTTSKKNVIYISLTATKTLDGLQARMLRLLAKESHISKSKILSSPGATLHLGYHIQETPQANATSLHLLHDHCSHISSEFDNASAR